MNGQSRAESNRPFDFPKPTDLIEELLSFTTTGDDIVLDCFAGSGTTGEAVLRLNRADRQNRRFLLVEMKPRIAEEITSERLRRVISGYTNAKGQRVAGLGGGFRYCQLGEPLFDELGSIRDGVSFADLAAHVFFTETGRPLPSRRPRSPLLGTDDGVGVYLLYNGILGDRSAAGGNVLTGPVLDELPAHHGPKVIYGTRCLLGDLRLRQERIRFKQTPYEIQVK